MHSQTAHHSGRWSDRKIHKKSCIRKKLNLLTLADSSTITKKFLNIQKQTKTDQQFFCHIWLAPTTTATDPPPLPGLYNIIFFLNTFLFQNLLWKWFIFYFVNWWQQEQNLIMTTIFLTYFLICEESTFFLI